MIPFWGDGYQSRALRMAVILGSLWIIGGGAYLAKRAFERPRGFAVTECSTPTETRVFQPQWTPFDATWVDIQTIRNSTSIEYRERYQLDEFLSAAESALRQDPELCGVSALEYGLPLRIVYMRSVIALNPYYDACDDQPQMVSVEEESVLCHQQAENITVKRHKCVNGMWFDLLKDRPVRQKLLNGDAVCLQGHVDLHNAGMPRCAPSNVFYMKRCASADALQYARAFRARNTPPRNYTPQVEL